jgi:chaperone modulatory protein CbpM
MALGKGNSFASVHGGVSMHNREFLMQSRLDAQALDAWIEAGWLRPRGSREEREFADIDLARARLIGDLSGDLGINDEAIPVVLDLIDQIHGLRRLVRELLERR